MLISRKLNVLGARAAPEYMVREAGRSRRDAQVGNGGGCMAARGDENSIMYAAGCGW